MGVEAGCGQNQGISQNKQTQPEMAKARSKIQKLRKAQGKHKEKGSTEGT